MRKQSERRWTAPDLKDAVVCTVGGKPGDSQRADYPGARNWIDACVTSGPDRFILVSAIGCGESRALLPPPVLERIGEAVAEKDKVHRAILPRTRRARQIAQVSRSIRSVGFAFSDY